MQTKPKLLIVEDEEAIRSGLADLFSYHGFEVDLAVDGPSGLEKALNLEYQGVILDVMLPGMDGFSVCNAIRKHNRLLPIIMLTAKSSEEDIIAGLSIGADDYISKPFSVRELVLRVEAVLRRSQGLRNLSVGKVLIMKGKLEIDSKNLSGTLLESNQTVEFSRREIDLLLYLMEHNDRPVPRDELLEQIWGYARASQIETRTVDIHIAKLRRKIESDPKNPTLLLTLRGEGYKLAH